MHTSIQMSLQSILDICRLGQRVEIRLFSALKLNAEPGVAVKLLVDK